MPWCALRYCKNNSRNTNKVKGVTFHRFPRQTEKNREKWIKFVRKDRSEENWLPADHTYICSIHFRDKDKYTTDKGRFYLKKSAVPCYNKAKSNEIDKCGTENSITEEVSDSKWVVNTPTVAILKEKLKEANLANEKMSSELKKVKQRNRYLTARCKSVINLAKSLKHIILADARRFKSF